MMRSKFGHFVLAGLVPAFALAAWAAPASGPVEWKGSQGKAAVKLFVDGQKATGELTADLPAMKLQMDLSGSGSAARYTGTMRGTGTRQERSIPMTGSWEANLASGSAQIQIKVNRPNGTAMPFNMSLSQAQYAPLRVASLRGTGTRKHGSGPAAALHAGDAIQKGDVIETGAGSAAIVVLGDSSVVLMQEKTRIEVPDNADNQDKIQRVKAKGKVWFAVQKVQGRGKFEVETDEAVAAVRGTEFLVETDQDTGETNVTTAEGQVDMVDPQGQRPPIPVPAGSRWQLPPRARRQGLFWRASQRVDITPYVRPWIPMLNEADRHWSFRRHGKAQFWQNRFERRQEKRGQGKGPGNRRNGRRNGPLPPGNQGANLR